MRPTATSPAYITSGALCPDTIIFSDVAGRPSSSRPVPKCLFTNGAKLWQSSPWLDRRIIRADTTTRAATIIRLSRRALRVRSSGRNLCVNKSSLLPFPLSPRNLAFYPCSSDRRQLGDGVHHP